MDGPEKIVQEGSAVLSIKDDVFYSERQVLQRDLSVAVLRAFRKTRISGDFSRTAAKEERLPGAPKSGKDCSSLGSGDSADSRVSPAETVLKVCDTLAGGGVRAIRYALEAGPVHVVANDRSRKACEAALRNARLSGIDPRKAPWPRRERTDVDPLQCSGDNFIAIRSSPTQPCIHYCDRDSNPDSDSIVNASVRSSAPSGTPLRSDADQSAASWDRPIGDTIFSSRPLSSSPRSPSSVGSFFVRFGDANAVMRYGAGGITPRELYEASAREGRRDADTSPGWDFIDVDPFGSCLPFLEAAVAGARDGGLLAVAATDMAVLCGKKGSQKCRSKYRASVADRPFAKEAAIRVVLHRMDVLARQRAKRIKPLLCVALDFYVRLFVTVLPSGDGSDSQQTLFVAQRADSPEFRVVPPSRGEEEEVLASGNVPGNNPTEKVSESGLVADCCFCSYDCPRSRLVEGASRRPGHGDATIGTATAPVAHGVSGCTGRVTTLGPFWRGPLFEPTFVDAVIEEVKRSRNARGERHQEMMSTLDEGVGMRPPPSCPETLVKTPDFSDTSRQETEDFEAGDPPPGDADKKDGETLSVAPLATTTTTSSVGGPLNLASRGQLLFLLETIARELVDCPLFYSLADVSTAHAGVRGWRSSGGGKTPALPRVEAVWEELRSAGYECSGSHAEPRSIKTLAPLEEVEAAVLRAIAKAAQARVRVGEQLGDEGQEQHSQQGSLRVARARIEREMAAKGKFNHDATTVEDMGKVHGGRDDSGGGGAGDGTEVGPRVPVGFRSLPILHAVGSSPSPGCIAAGHDNATSAQGTSFPAHLTLASLKGFLDNSLASEPTCGGVGRDSADVRRERDRRNGYRSAPPTAGARFICVRALRGISGIFGAESVADMAAVEAGQRAEERFAGEEIALERSLSARWPKEVAFCDSLREACALAASERSSERSTERLTEEDVKPCATVFVLGGRHDLGDGGLHLATAGMRIVGVRGSDDRLPLLEGRPGSHAVTCAAIGVSLRSLHVRAGSSAPVLSPPSPTATNAPAKGFQGVLKAGGRGGDSGVPAADRGLASRDLGGVREGGMVRKRPRLIFDRAAAQAVMASTAAAAAAAAAGKTRNKDDKRRRHRDSKRESPTHAISVEGGTAIVSGCDVSSYLPYACVCVSGASTSASLVEGTRVSDGSGMGLLVCGKGEASASGCSFEAMGAAGVESRSGSRVTLSECVVSGSGRSGVFVQGFSSARLSRCEVLGSSFAGVEALRNASLSMDACRVVGSRRGGVLIHGASEAILRDCVVSGSYLAGVDVRTGAEATLEACVVRDGKTSGIYVSAGGNISVSSTLLRSNRLAALEVNDQRQSRREGHDAIAGGRNSLAAAIDDIVDSCTVSLGAGNLMLGNGLDDVMQTGGGEKGG